VKKRDFIRRSLMRAFSFLQESIFSDEYAARPGFLQARDARIKAIGILLLLLAVMFSRDIYFLIAMYLVCLLLAVFSSIGLGFFFKRTWIFIPLFALFIALPAIFEVFTPGAALARIQFLGLNLTITRQGVIAAVFFFTRVLTSVSLCVLLALTTRHFVLLKALRNFGVPQVFVMTLGMCYRYLYLFIEIIENTYMAIKSRVGVVSSTKKGQMVVAWNIGGLWQRSYALHNQVYGAMLARGYTGEPKYMDESRPGCKDWLWLGAAVLILGMGLWLNRYMS